MTQRQCDVSQDTHTWTCVLKEKLIPPTPNPKLALVEHEPQDTDESEGREGGVREFPDRFTRLKVHHNRTISITTVSEHPVPHTHPSQTTPGA